MTVRPLTLLDHGVATFERLTQALELGDEPSALFRTLIAPLASSPLLRPPSWASDISDDHTPYEFSVSAGDEGTEVRALFEAKGELPDLPSRQQAAHAVNQWLERRHPIALGRLRAVEELFLPAEPEGGFAMWHAVAFARERAPTFRVYLNPSARGRALAPSVVEEALERLGLRGAFRTLLAHALARGPQLDDLRYFSLDLADTADARVKVYAFHEQASADEIEAAAQAARNYVPGEVADFCRALAGPGPYGARAIATCHAFTSADVARPQTVTVHVPVRDYAPNDEVAHQRLLAYLDRRDARSPALERAVQVMARRPLAAGSGLITYASMRPAVIKPRLTLYLATEAYRTDPPRATAVATRAPAPQPTPVEIVRSSERDPLTWHPFFQRMQREPVQLPHMWRLFTNIRSGLSAHFPRRLAAVVARVTDERIRSLLARQLDEELGEGDYTKAHLVLFDELLAGLLPYRPDAVDELDLEAGRALAERLEVPYADGNGHVGVGAAMVIEIFGKQVDRFVAAQFRRQDQVPPALLTWLHLHESLELEHAEESMTLARLVPDDGAAQAAVARGARAVADAGWEFFDHMYRACYR
jgi:pyrroloquinoline quinone (PQQ) biosynthesis protein C